MAKKKEKNELVQTKGEFKVVGKVTRIDKDGAFKEDVGQRGKHKGDTYHSLRFGVKTSETNEVTVEMFDYEPEEVFLWHSEKAKEAKDKNRKYKGLRVPFDEWLDTQDELREQGHSVLQSRVGLTYGEDGKIQSQGLPKFVASQMIYDALDNGDSVAIEGEIRYSQYENQQGKVVQKKQFFIEKCYKLKKDVDFENAKFEEVAYFEQPFVYVDAEPDKANKKVWVTGRTIDFKGDWNDSQFVVDYSDGDGGNDSDMVSLADGFAKKIKFGDLIKVFGTVENRVIVEEVEEEEGSEEDKLLATLGGKSKPKHAQKFQNRTYISEMKIEGIEAWDKKMYSEDDFVKDELVDKGEDDEDKEDDLGGKPNKKGSKNPFKSDEDETVDPDDISDDDLPF